MLDLFIAQYEGQIADRATLLSRTRDPLLHEQRARDEITEFSFRRRRFATFAAAAACSPSSYPSLRLPRCRRDPIEEGQDEPGSTCYR